MSFKIFSLQLFGKIKPVEKIEQQRKTLYQDYLEFQETEQSEELAEFFQVEKEVQSSEFKNKKAEIKSLEFKGSKEFELQKEFEKLKKSKPIKLYLKVYDSDGLRRYESLKDSDKLKEFHELFKYVKKGGFQQEKKEIKSQKYKSSKEHRKTKELEKLKKSSDIKEYLSNPESEKVDTDSYNIKRYLELKSEVESPEFQKREAYLKDNKKFEKSEAYEKWQRFKELSKNDDVKFVLKYEKSALYKNYLNVAGSSDLSRYEELKELIASQEFQERKAYLEDKKKWEKTEEFAKETKYEELKKRPKIEKYFKYKGTSAFAFFEEWEVAFEDEFNLPAIDTKKWSAKSYVAEKMIDDNYSLAGDLNIFTTGKNIKTDRKLIIETRKEKTEGKIWNPVAGFIPVALDYSSGVISSAPDFWQEDGIFEAKIKFSPVKQVVSSFYLQGEKNSPRVHLLEMGTKNRLGISTVNTENKVEMNGLDISNLSKNKWYILTLEKNGTQFTWKINETEVLQLDDSTINFSMHLGVSTLVVNEISGSDLPVKFEIDWVKCFRKK